MTDDNDILVGESVDSFAVGQLNGKVVLTFPQPIRWLAIAPENAGPLGEQLARLSYHIKTGRDPNQAQSIITAEIRNRLVTRITHVIRSMDERKRLPGHIASEVVDIILSEVT